MILPAISSRRRRGAVVLVFVVVLLGGAAAGVVAHEQLSALADAKDARIDAAQRSAAAAKNALRDYMLRRSSRPFNIERPGGRAIPPRLLMLPCPDNVGDNNLDGAQDPTCGADGRSKRNLTNGVLSSGARFGRLPARSRYSHSGEMEMSDGLEGDFRGGGGELWYALSRHFAPSVGGAPLNLHRLDSLEDGWLSIVQFAPMRSPPLLTVHSRVAAVALAPGRNSGGGRLAESFAATASLNLEDVAASLYFESAGGESNADADGVFVVADAGRNFDDFADYVGAEELLDADGRFMRDYVLFAGAGDVHNAPRIDSPLADIRIALAEWRDFFGFYPPPAANISVHVGGRARHCAAHHVAAGTRAAADAETALLAAAAATLSAPAAAGVLTATLRGDAAFLTATEAEATLSAALSAVIGDLPTVVRSRITLARYARVTLFADTEIIADSELLISVGGGYELPPGATVSLAAAASLDVPARAPLSAAAMTHGWLPEHHRTTMTIARDGLRISLSAPAAAGFIGAATLTSSVSVVVAPSGARLEIQNFIHIEKDFAQLSLLYEDAALRANGAAATLRAADGYKPDLNSFAKQHFVALIFADALVGGRAAPAPQIVYPWRRETAANAVTRDNAHPYPPCFDSRELPRRARTFIEDQNLYYVVSPGCRDGGACGGEISTSVAAGARFAAPQSFALSGSFTATLLGGAHTLTATGGAANADWTAPAAFLLPLSEPPSAAARLDAGFEFARGQRIVVTEGATVVAAGGGVRIDRAHAILIYSPAPLANTRCLRGMPSAATYSAGGATLARQGGGGADLTTPCQWLDDDENADGDLSFHIRPSARDGRVNDYFMIFGGQVVVE